MVWGRSGMDDDASPFKKYSDGEVGTDSGWGGGDGRCGEGELCERLRENMSADRAAMARQHCSLIKKSKTIRGLPDSNQ